MDFEGTEDEGVSERASALAKKYAGLLVFLGIAAAVAYYFLFLVPKPASASVYVRELDGGPVNGAEVYFTSGGRPLGASQITRAGSASFSDLKQGAVLVTVDAGGAFEPMVQEVELSPGENSVSLSIARKNGVQVLAHTIAPEFPAGCRDSFSISLYNSGPDAFEALLLAEGNEGFVKSVTLPAAPVVILPNKTANFSVGVAVPDPGSEELRLAGAIRVRKTGIKVEVDSPVGPKMQVEPSEQEIIYTPGSQDARLVTIRNSGTQPFTNFAYSISVEERLKAECGEDGSACFSIEQLGGAQPFIAPGSKADLVVRITPPTPQEDYFATLLVSGSCLSNPGLSVPIRLNLKQS